MRFFTFLILLLSVNAWAGIAGTTVNLTANQFDTVCNNGAIERKFKGVCPGSWTAGSLPVQGGGSGGSGSSGGLLALSDLEYQGSFRVDYQTYGSSQVAYNAKWLLGLNTQTGRLLINGSNVANTRDVGEFEIPPTLSTSTNVADLPIAANTQPFVDVFDQIPSRTVDINEDTGVGIYGIYEYNNNILFNYAVYYDAAPPFADDSTFVKRSADLDASTSDVVGAYKMGCGALCSGWMSPIPTKWQAALGGDHITGFSAGTTRAILSRLSVGPSAFAFTIGDILNSPPASGSTIPTIELMNFQYPNAMGMDDVSNVDADLVLPGRYWNNATETNYGFIPVGFDTYMITGHQAGYLSGLRYGDRDNTTQTDWGNYDAIDPDDYRNIYALFDVNEFVRVRNGEIAAHEIIPYAWGAFTSPFGGTPESGINALTGAVYDPATRLLYLSFAEADTIQDTFSNQPVISVYRVGGAN